jgi:hypothetical protein
MTSNKTYPIVKIRRIRDCIVIVNMAIVILLDTNATESFGAMFSWIKMQG